MARAQNPVKDVLEAAVQWAARNGLRIDGNSRTETIDQNLFQPLNPHTRAELEEGAGNELAGDFRSLRSSAALACNVFDYWRGRDPRPITVACGADLLVTDVSFERKFPTGLGGTPPHLDVVLEGVGAKPTAIECKFTELYAPAHNEFRDSYIASAGLWKGLPRSRMLAESIHANTVIFERLGAAQLIKHALGLNRAFGPAGFRLLYLWFDVSGEASKRHALEIGSFAEAIDGDFEFAALTYQELFLRLVVSAGSHGDYLGYLAARYFPGLVEGM